MTRLKKPAAAPKPPPTSAKDNVRETVESIVIAFVLAFLFRTFEAEAFVIPTGSMAPTLMGQHKDVPCDMCGFLCQVSASVDQDANDRDRRNSEVVMTICPQCRYRMPIDYDPATGEPRGVMFQSFHGDRILVSKFSYGIAEPRRWDVAVFKYPQMAKQNYIKRLVGLPGETVKIAQGDIHVRRPGEEFFTIQRKSHKKCQAMLQLVFDNDYISPLVDFGWAPRWYMAGSSIVNGSWHLSTPLPEGSWEPVGQFKSYTTSGARPEMVWLRYQHTPPLSTDWAEAESGRMTPAEMSDIKPQLISDSYGYNSHVQRGQYSDEGHGIVGGHWVGDLAVECELDIGGDSGQVELELVKGGFGFRARFDVASGDAELVIDGYPEFRPRAVGVLRGPGRYQVRFANVDEQLLLWINNRPVSFSTPTTYPPIPGNQIPDVHDLAPVGIGAQGVKMTAAHLRVLRDVYYVAIDQTSSNLDYLHSVISGAGGFEKNMTLFLQGKGPRGWDPIGQLRTREFQLDADQFLMLGDNSPRSQDSRLWSNHEYYVRRDLLIGKALFVYWPHGWPFEWSVGVNLFGMRVYLPFVPNIGRMRLIK